MKIGYYVQGDADEAFIRGLAQRWCPAVELAPGKFRGASRESFRREIKNALIALKNAQECHILVVLTDSDVNPWRDIKRREWGKVPLECQDITVFGVADRNIECWMAIDRQKLAQEFDCLVEDIPVGDPSGFVKRRFGLGLRDIDKDRAKERVKNFVATAPLKTWIENSDSFDDFYRQVRTLAIQQQCVIPNERETDQGSD